MQLPEEVEWFRNGKRSTFTVHMWNVGIFYSIFAAVCFSLHVNDITAGDTIIFLNVALKLYPIKTESLVDLFIVDWSHSQYSLGMFYLIFCCAHPPSPPPPLFYFIYLYNKSLFQRRQVNTNISHCHCRWEIVTQIRAESLEWNQDRRTKGLEAHALIRKINGKITLKLHIKHTEKVKWHRKFYVLL